MKGEELSAALHETLSHYIERHKAYADALDSILSGSHPDVADFLKQVERLIRQEEDLVRDGSAMKNRMEKLRREETARSGEDPFAQEKNPHLLKQGKKELERLTALRNRLMVRLEELLKGSRQEKALIERARALIQTYSQRPASPPAQFLDRKR